MVEVHAILKRLNNESAMQFRKRCGDFVMYSEFPGIIGKKHFIIARMTQIGRHFFTDPDWRETNKNKVSSNICYIVSYGSKDVHKFLIDINENIINNAPINPVIFPRLPYLLMPNDFINDVKIKKINDEQCLNNDVFSWSVHLDGNNLGIAHGSSKHNALLLMHENEVEKALNGCSSDIDNNNYILPDKMVLNYYQNLRNKYKKIASLVDEDIVWSNHYKILSHEQGWHLVENNGRILLKSIFPNKISDHLIWIKVFKDSSDLHNIARTYIALHSPFEYFKIKIFLRNFELNTIKLNN